ncbi:hypothetical protein ERJ70_03475 [Sediminibacillus dalangtanensis]|uniref:YusW-like protein n=1 Tax=Sediminibacillus dalangtanensis TaxID=2729421 RepID=A0ABX7VR36_9BACI|nr:hypothetical protein [Sediminibacillus dalangtanensis]QTM98439.1 hypothetical protein ERJ70_03475 [Sediminibacillus dalangtanensis]
MKKMKFFFGVMMAALLLISLGACSKANDETSSTTDTSTKEETVDSSSSTDKDSGDSESNKQEEAGDEPGNEDEKEQNTSEADHESDTETADEQTNTNTDGSDGKKEDLDVEEYLNENYAIKNTHYETETWENEDTGETECMVKILPDTKESDEEITGALKNGENNERIDTMMNLAEKIMDDLTEKNNNIHVDSVNYVSYDGDYGLTLIQDYR